MLPQILRGPGMDSLLLPAPGPARERLPSAGRSGGSRPTARGCWPTASRTSTAAPREDVGQTSTSRSRSCRRPVGEMMVFYGVGNHGGGPTRANIESIHRAGRRRGSMPHARVRSTPDARSSTQVRERGIDDSRSSRDDLQHHAPGCYSAHSGIKRWQRARASTRWPRPSVGGRSPAGRRASRTRATSSSAPGSRCCSTSSTTSCPARRSSPRTRTPATSSARRWRSPTAAHNAGIQSLASRIDDRRRAAASTPIVVFNPHAWPVPHDGRARVRRAQGDRRPGRRRRPAGAVPGDPVVRDRVRVAEPAGDRRGPASARVPPRPCRRC